MVKLKDWPRKPLVTAPRGHVDIIKRRATNRPPEGTNPTVYDWERDEPSLEAWEGNQ